MSIERDFDPDAFAVQCTGTSACAVDQQLLVGPLHRI